MGVPGGSTTLPSVLSCSALKADDAAIREAPAEQLGMQYLCEDLQTIHDSGPRTAEVRRAVHSIDAPLPDRRDVFPIRIRLQNREVFQRPRHFVSAAGQHNDFGLRLQDVLPSYARRIFTLAANWLDAPRN